MTILFENEMTVISAKKNYLKAYEHYGTHLSYSFPSPVRPGD
jgi:hypothetical protein